MNEYHDDLPASDSLRLVERYTPHFTTGAGFQFLMKRRISMAAE